MPADLDLRLHLWWFQKWRDFLLPCHPLARTADVAGQDLRRDRRSNKPDAGNGKNMIGKKMADNDLIATNPD
jgi:hypothetical protein